MTESKRDIGERVRREVMSDPFVDRALNNTTDFDHDLQDMVMEMAWGNTWARDENIIPRKIRSLLTISMLAAMRATDELKGHVRGALRNGCSKEEIKEALLHVAPYAGCPASIGAFRAAKEIIEEWEKSE